MALNFRLSSRQLALLASAVLASMVLWQLAGLLWLGLTPSQAGRSLRLPAAAPAAQQQDPNLIARLFSGPASSVASEASSNLKLKALVSGANGVAIIEGLEASAVAVKLGQEAGSHGKLVAAERDHIVLELNGQRRKVFLEQQSIAPQANTGNTNSTIPTQSTTTASAAPATTLTRGQLTGILQGGNLANWSKGLATHASGGIAVEAASQQALASVLQLRDGDIIKSVNGRNLAKLEDLSLLYAAFSQQSAVSVQIVRAGEAQTLSYTVNP
ncbi:MULTISPECIES: hypothetical protein [Chitinibacter]|uniref:hypothetical protein n=1 Tax=Chitinibacter TaxID=230666 RepID=UPI00041BF773|nr:MULTISPECIES: hypothetical protein [Chitinibacter]